MYFAMTTVVNLDDMQKKSLMETAQGSFFDQITANIMSQRCSSLFPNLFSVMIESIAFSADSETGK